MKKEKEVDKIFKHGLADPVDEAAYRESDWDAFEQMLDKNKKRPAIIYWLPALSSAAAILLFLGWWMFRPQPTDNVKPRQQVAVTPIQTVQSQGVIAPKTQKTNDDVASTSSTVNTAVVNPGKIQAEHSQPEYLAAATNTGRGHAKSNPIFSQTDGAEGRNIAVINKNTERNSINTTTGYTELTAANLPLDITIGKANRMPVIASVNILPKAVVNNTDQAKADKSGIKKTGFSYHPQFALSVIASSELNGVNSLQQGSSGTNIGLMFSASLFKKFTITTGADYTLKPYTLAYDEYHSTYRLKNAPESVSADCRMLDIPINIDYQVYNKHLNKISIGTGLSSYIMMHESYTYNYGDQSSLYGPAVYAVKNPSKYLFSIMNLEATYQRQINSKVGISFEPYLKVPLSNIGYSQVKVETFGVAVGLNWNINSLTKPK